MARRKQIVAHVMLKPGRTQSFQRCVRDAKGDPVGKLVFQPAVAVPVTATQAEAVTGDIGNALVIAKSNDSGPPHPDWEMTAEVVRERNGGELPSEPDEDTDGDAKPEESDSEGK